MANNCIEKKVLNSVNTIQFELHKLDLNLDGIISTDSEWDSFTWICTQFFVHHKREIFKVIYLNNSLNNVDYDLIKNICNERDIILFLVDDGNNLLEHLQNSLEIQSGNFHLQIFYSPKDIRYAVGADKQIEVLFGLTKKRAISGKFKIGNCEYSVKDLSGWVNGGLKKLADSVGVDMQSKDALDDYKANMLQALIDKPEVFIEYSMADVTDLYQISTNFLELVRYVQNVIGLPEEDQFIINDLPTTVGSIVAISFEKWLSNLYRDKDLLKLALTKNSTQIIKKYKGKDGKISSQNVDYTLLNKVSKIKSVDDFKNNRKHVETFFEKIKFEHLSYSNASIPVWGLTSHKKSTELFNSIVQGGRCINSRPFEHIFKYIADIDLNSCYGTALLAMYFMFGRPKIYERATSQQPITLGKFLEKYEPEFSDNCWNIIVEGDLSFLQDIIFSKIINPNDVIRLANSINDKNNESWLDGEFFLARKKIQNGIITSDVLKVIRKVASSQELAEIKKLKVVTASWYDKNLECANIEEYINLSLKDTFKSKFGTQTKGNHWLRIPLEKYVKPLITERKSLKASLKNLSKGSDEYQRIDAKQEILKLFINCLFGVICSPYFPIGNSIVANNITAKARVGSWMQSKALNGITDITDGSLYQPMLVSFYGENRKPSLTKLASMWKYADVKSGFKFKPLGAVDWTEEYDKVYAVDNLQIPEGEEFTEREKLNLLLTKKLDTLAVEHIQSFWAPYNLNWDEFYTIEHKADHNALAASVIGKANYALRTLKDQTIVKLRGSKIGADYIPYFSEEKDVILNERGEETLPYHPSHILLRQMLDDNDTLPQIKNYEHKELQTLGEWLYLITDKSGKIDSDKLQKYPMPGEEKITERVFDLNINHLPVCEYSELKHRKQWDYKLHQQLRRRIDNYETYSDFIRNNTDKDVLN